MLLVLAILALLLIALLVYADICWRKWIAARRTARKGGSK